MVDDDISLVLPERWVDTFPSGALCECPNALYLLRSHHHTNNIDTSNIIHRICTPLANNNIPVLNHSSTTVNVTLVEEAHLDLARSLFSKEQ